MRAHTCIIQLRESNQNLDVPTTQRGVKGHVIVYPQKPSELVKVLPPAIEDVVTPICVLFIGSSLPSREWLRTKAKPLVVRREKVRKALEWLKSNNPLYSDVNIDYNNLNSLETEFVPPVHIEIMSENEGAETLMSRYDNYEDLLHAHAPAHELRAAALRHVKQKGGSFIQLPHDPKPVNEFNNPLLLPMIYPTLFPFGIGGPEDSKV
ncbi:hypothetical protein BDQ17DRAFT_1249152 [Cyathus striatus]|nr:hypothetical protein BDQ17DRAFT_1249152 [Cyathus striatus]